MSLRKKIILNRQFFLTSETLRPSLTRCQARHKPKTYYIVQNKEYISTLNRNKDYRMLNGLKHH